jgi:hypothetical protein
MAAYAAFFFSATKMQSMVTAAAGCKPASVKLGFDMCTHRLVCRLPGQRRQTHFDGTDA